MALSRGTGLGGSGLSDGLPNLGGSGGEDRFDPTASFAPGANSAWDFINNYARFKDVYYGPLANTPGWSFTRASTGYAQTSAGALTAFASGELRRTDKGVLIEGAGTNLCLQSQTFDNASWSKVSATASANAYVAPDGTSTMDGVLASSGSSGHYFQQNLTWTNVVHTTSFYVRYVNHRWISITTWDGTTNRNASFDLLNGAVGATSGATSTITSLGGGVYRITLTGSTAQAAAAGNITIGLNDTDSASVRTWNAAGTEVFGAWGAQIEATAYASSYVPTTTGSATRAADSLTVTGVSGLASTLTAFAEFEFSGADSSVSPNGRVALSVTNGTPNERMYLYNISGNIGGLTQNGGVSQAAPSVVGTVPVGTSIKIAYRQDANNFQFCKNGTLGTIDATGTLPSTPNEICLGGGVGGVGPLYGYLRRLAIFSRALSDAELQALTT